MSCVIGRTLGDGNVRGIRQIRDLILESPAGRQLVKLYYDYLK